MAVRKGLAALQRSLNESTPTDGDKARWLQVKPGQSVRLTFMSELDTDSEYYDELRGQAIVVAEHVRPDEFRKRALCTADEGKCFGCEQAAEHPAAKGKPSWKPKVRFYANVLVDNGTDDPYVAIFQTNAGFRGTVANQLMEYAVENGGISQIQWKYSRQGDGLTTSYTLTPGRTVTTNWEGFEPFDLEARAVKQVSYDEQRDFYYGEDEPTSTDW